MCGLFGAYHPLSLNKDELLQVKTLGFLSQLRGFDSSGITFVGRSHIQNSTKLTYTTHRDTISCSRLLSHDSVRKSFEEKNNTVVMGHSRWATHGDITLDNTQPILLSKLIGTHNGVFKEYAPDDKDFNNIHKSDSVCFYNNANDFSVKDALYNCYLDAYALVYIDKEANSINFIRNEKRDLFFMRSKKRSTIYWSSERRMLEFVKENDPNYEDPETFIAGMHYEFKFGEAVPTLISYERKVFSHIKLEQSAIGPAPLTDVTPKQNTVNYKRDAQGVPLGSYKAHRGVVYAPSLAQKILRNGCCFCEKSSSLEDTSYWISDTEYLCSECRNDDFIKTYVAKTFYKSEWKPVKVM